MKNLSLLLLLALSTALYPQSASAQSSSSAPDGTYLKSCNAITMVNGVLSATCASNGSSTTRHTSVEVARCSGDIWNSEGILQCYARSFAVAQGNAIPRGSYTDSCHGGWLNSPYHSIRVEGTTLLGAMCRKRDGKSYVFDPRLDLRTCLPNSNITNNDGQLVCIVKNGN